MEQELGDTNNKLPVIVIGNKILGGREEIFKSLETYINKSLQKKKISLKEAKIDPKIISKKFKIIQLISILLAGFVDGINPCAFVTIIFLLSYLVFIGREKKQIFLAGISFAIGVFIIYFLIGLGALKFIQNLSSYVYISKLIYFLTNANIKTQLNSNANNTS